jgi:hypothetical protein
LVLDIEPASLFQLTAISLSASAVSLLNRKLYISQQV